MRVLDGVCLALVIGGAAYVFDVKHDAEQAHGARRDLERSIAHLNEDVSLLEADLAALERPARLEAIVGAMPDVFGLEPIASTHYVRLSDLPFRADLIAESTGSIDVDGEGTDAALSGTNLEAVSEPVSELDSLLADILAREAEFAPPPAPATDVPQLAVEPPASSDGIADLLERVQ